MSNTQWQIRKRLRDGEGVDEAELGRDEKRARPTPNSIDNRPRDSVISTPPASTASYQHAHYDSDSHSSMLSEPGSPQDLSMDSGDDMELGFSAPAPAKSTCPQPPSSPWRRRCERIPTPLQPLSSPSRGPRSVHQHVRQRHPPSSTAAPGLSRDAARTPGDAPDSALSMLGLDDVDMDAPAAPVAVRKQRQRSGALSSGASDGGGGGRRGVSMGFRADCEKCRLRVPGHMNHFIA